MAGFLKSLDLERAGSFDKMTMASTPGKKSTLRKKGLTPSNKQQQSSLHKTFTPRKPSGTPSSLRKKKFTPKQYTPSGLNKNNEENNHMNTPLPFGGKMITFDSENIHPNNENRSRSISTTSSTNTPQRPRTPLSSRRSSTKSSKKKSTNKSNRTLKATSSFNNSILSDSLPSLDTMNINLINQNRPTSSPSAFRRSSSSSSSNRKSKNKSNRTPSPLGSETTISELDLGNSNVNTNENIDSNNYYEGKMNNDDYMNNNTNVKNNKGKHDDTKDENENDGNDGPPSPIPVRRRSSKRYMMQQEQKKTMKGLFINKQKLKGLTSSPADSTFSPISRQFLRRDDKRGIMKKTNIQRVIAERNKMNNNNQNHKFFESKINNDEMSKKEEDDESYITTTTTTTTIISSPMPQHRLKRSNNDKNNNNTLHKTPRQLPSLLGGINKKNIINGGLGKYSSPSDMLLSPASKAFTTGTIGTNGKLQKGNVRKLIALKNHEGKNINNRGSSRLSNNVSTSALNKK